MANANFPLISTFSNQSNERDAPLQRKEYPVAVKCYKRALEYYNDIPATTASTTTPEEYKELLQLMEERLRVMRQVANIFKRIANLIQSGQIST